MTLTPLIMIVSVVCADPPQRRAIRAVRTPTPPVLDGKLDDACWQRAPVAGDFRRFAEGTPAIEPTEARMLYDTTHLYFAFRCAEPRMDLVRADVKKSPSAFNYGYGNNIEIFLDPGASKKHYWQFMANTNGHTQTNLATHDLLHLGTLDWRAKVFLGPDAFTIEVAVPFALLHVKPGWGKTWGVNFCRARQVGKKEAAYMYSSWQPMHGSFLRPELFGRLHIDADLSRFAYDVVVPERVREGDRFQVSIANRTGQARRVKAAVRLTRLDGTARAGTATLTTDPDVPTTLSLGVFQPADTGAEIRVTLCDAHSGERVFVGSTQTIDETR